MGTLECPLCCRESFPDKWSLKCHLLSNATISCPTCLRGFSTIVEFANHLDNSCDGDGGRVLAGGAQDATENRVAANGEIGGKSSEQASNNPSVTRIPSPTDGDHTNESVKPADELTSYEVIRSHSIVASVDTEEIQRWDQENGGGTENNYFCVSCNCSIQGVAEHVARFHPNELEVHLQTAEVVTMDTGARETEHVDSTADPAKPVENVLPVRALGPSCELDHNVTTNKDNSPVLLNNVVRKKSVTNTTKTVPNSVLSMTPLVASKLAVERKDISSVNPTKKDNSPVLLNNVVRKRSVTNTVKTFQNSELPRTPLVAAKLDISRDEATNVNNSPVLLNNVVRKRPSTNTVTAVESQSLEAEDGGVVDNETLVEAVECEEGVNDMSDTGADSQLSNIAATGVVVHPSLRDHSTLARGLDTLATGVEVHPSLRDHSTLARGLDMSATGTDVHPSLRDHSTLVRELDMSATGADVHPSLRDHSTLARGLDTSADSQPSIRDDKPVVPQYVALSSASTSDDSGDSKRQKLNDVVLKFHMVDKSGMHYVRNVVKINKFWEAGLSKKFVPRIKKSTTRVPKNVNKVVAPTEGRTDVTNTVDTVIPPGEVKSPTCDVVVEKVSAAPPTTIITRKILKIPKVNTTTEGENPPSLIAALKELSKTGPLISMTATSSVASTPGPRPNLKPKPSIYKMLGTDDDAQKEEPRKLRARPKIKKVTLASLKKKVRNRKALFKVTQEEDKRDPILMCSTCKAEFPNYSRFSDHECYRVSVTSAGPGKDAGCSVCGVECMTVRDLNMHHSTHQDEDPKRLALARRRERRCEICHMVSYSPVTFRSHYNAHVRDQQAAADPLLGVLTCNKCSLVFRSNEDLKKHWQVHREGGPGEVVLDFVPEEGDEDFYRCNLCDKQFPEGGREAHQLLHQGKQTFACGACNKRFPLEAHLEMHMTVHKIAESSKACFYCKLTFNNVYLLRAHVMATHTVLDRPYSCGFCGRRFYKAMERRRHERIHTGEKDHKCQVCGARFRSVDALRRHTRIHTGVRPYECTHCGKSFRTLSGIRHHEETHSTLRPYVCSRCPKTFKSRIQFHNHKKQHDKPFTCTCCGRRFADMFTMRGHMRAHSNGTLNHVCYICGASYGRDFALRDHMKDHPNHEAAPEEMQDKEKTSKKRKKRTRPKQSSSEESDKREKQSI